MRRAVFILTLVITGQSSAAGVLEKCQAQSAKPDKQLACSVTEHQRSENQLRNQSLFAKRRVIHAAQNDGRKLMREYRKSEARHVRERNHLCRKQKAGLQRNACIADMNDKHREALSRFTQ